MPEPTASASIAGPHDLTPGPAADTGGDLRGIDLAPAAAGGPEALDDGARAHLAQAGQDALDACLRRFTPEERAAFWQAICRCYNRPYNPPDASLADVAPPEIALADDARDAVPAAVPPAHVIEAVRPVPDAARPDAALR